MIFARKSDITATYVASVPRSFRMKKLDTSLLCIEISSIAFGYQALDAVTRSQNVRVLEASVLGSRFMILAIGEASEMKDAADRVRERIDGGDATLLVDLEIIERCAPEVTEAFYALSQVELAEGLVVVECATVSGILAAAQTLVQGHSLKAIEIRALRSSTGSAYGFFTGPEGKCGPAAEDVRARFKTAIRQGRVEVISRPTKEFRGFFQLSGES